MRVSVLGSIEVDPGDGAPRLVGARKERTVLAALCARPNQVVSADALIEAVWGDDPPATARKTLQTYVLHLRRLVGDRLVHRAPGYVLRLDDAELDALEFERLAAEGRRALLGGDGGRAVTRLGRALGLWRGEAFAGTPLADGAEGPGVRLARLRHAVELDHLEARLLAGDASALVPELEVATIADPLAERTWALLVRSLHQAGRRADALRAYQRARAVLADEVGLDPGPELRAAELAVLHDDGPPGSDAPQVSYVTNADGLRIAYAVLGSGSRDVVFCAEWVMSVELLTDLIELRPVLDQLTADARLIVVQRRGSALSDRDPDGFAPPQRCVGDVDAVLDAVGCSTASFVGWGHGGQVALAYAAARPDRVRDLALVNGYLRLAAADDHPDGLPVPVCEMFLEAMESMWGMPTPKVGIVAPEVGVDPAFISRITRIERLTATPREAVAIQRSLMGFDVRDLVADVRCPALVVHLSESITGRANALALTAALADAELIELPGAFLPTADESEAVARAIASFHRRPAARRAVPI